MAATQTLDDLYIVVFKVQWAHTTVDLAHLRVSFDLKFWTLVFDLSWLLDWIWAVTSLSLLIWEPLALSQPTSSSSLLFECQLLFDKFPTALSRTVRILFLVFDELCGGENCLAMARAFGFLRLSKEPVVWDGCGRPHTDGLSEEVRALEHELSRACDGAHLTIGLKSCRCGLLWALQELVVTIRSL